MKDKLTLEQLKQMEPDTIFASGTTTIDHPWEHGKTAYVKWIAIRGGIYDWAIYHSFDSNLMMDESDDKHRYASNRMIANHGSKLHDMDKVRELVPCDKDALEMYRH
jgi:hypothetical protein